MFVHLLMHSCIFFHVENVARVDPTSEVEETEEVYQEEQQEFMESDQVEEPVPEANFVNSDPQQGKHRFILKPRVFYTSLSLCNLLKYICAFKFIGIDWYLDAWVRIVLPIPWISLITSMIGSYALLSAIDSIEVECFWHSRVLKMMLPIEMP